MKYIESVHRHLIVTGLPWVGPVTTYEIELGEKRTVVGWKDVDALTREEFKRVDKAVIRTRHTILIENVSMIELPKRKKR